MHISFAINGPALRPQSVAILRFFPAAVDTYLIPFSLGESVKVVEFSKFRPALPHHQIARISHRLRAFEFF